MHLKNIDSTEVFEINVSKLTSENFLKCIGSSIKENKKLSIAYANADTLNKIYNDKNLKKIYNAFELVHPDGIGIYLASKFLSGKCGLDERLTGSDFYEVLIKESIKENWSYFFFGHDELTLQKIGKAYPDLNISAVQEGYKFDNEKVIEEINKINPDIIIIGLSCPIQEKWIYENKSRINFKVILAVGDGIKIFAKLKKRGPLFLRKLGFEWLTRYTLNPVSNFRKYILGNPLFIYRVIKDKLKST